MMVLFFSNINIKTEARARARATCRFIYLLTNVGDITKINLPNQSNTICNYHAYQNKNQSWQLREHPSQPSLRTLPSISLIQLSAFLKLKCSIASSIEGDSTLNDLMVDLATTKPPSLLPIIQHVPTFLIYSFEKCHVALKPALGEFNPLQRCPS